MKQKIESPKVFISYAWGDDEYQNLVLAFVSQLVRDGINVVFDKWDLTEGNDTDAFMEKCVTDSSITNVLMLLDPLYAKKADEHSGGVSTETQIISAQVYKEVFQDKFIPVVMKRDENNAICKPTYLQGRLHFDLTIAEKYDSEYQRLVRTLFGVQTYAKPEIGKKPNWVDNPIVAAPKTIVTYNSMKDIQNHKVRIESFVNYLNEIAESLITFAKSEGSSGNKLDDYIALYDYSESIRENYLQLIKNSSYIENSGKYISKFFENTINSIYQFGSLQCETVKIRVHEMFIYTIALFLNKEDYQTIGYLLGKTYFNQQNKYDNYGADGFNMFYSGSYHTNLDNAIKKRDDKNYYTGTGQHWIETISSEFCTTEQFVFADMMCFNYSVYGKNYNNKYAWFPITYCYENRYDSSIGNFALKLVSNLHVEETLPLFGYDNVESFIGKFKQIEELENNPYHDYRYLGAFESAQLLGYFIKSDKIATLP